MSNQAIAVVGIGSYYPGSKNLKELWENILSRRRQFRELPKKRLPLEEYYDENKDAPDKTYGRFAAVIDGFSFDWMKRRIPKTTYESTDIVHWLALEIAIQALEDAGYSRENIPKEKTGVLLGNTLTGEFTRANTMRMRWPYIQKTLRAAGKSQGLSQAVIHMLEQQMESIYKSAFPPANEDTLAGGLSNTIAGRICNYFDLHGGGYVLDGACSSSLLAVANASSKLANGELDIAIAGGVDISLDPLEVVGFAKAGALTSKDMNVYDRNSSGFIPGEGCGFVVLKRLEDARRDKDYVYAVLRGWGISSDGKGGITAPNVEGQALALRRAYEIAGYSPSELDFIEGHGTGTVLGDRVELEAISLARDMDQEASPRSCGVTSVKSIFGHTKAAAGIGGLLKAILSVNQRVLVPTAACKEPNDIFFTKAQNIYPILYGEVRDPSQTLRAGVSAMGFGGINCHVTLESGDAPKEELKPTIHESALFTSSQEMELFVFAADTLDHLKAQVNETLEKSQGISIAELVDLAYGLSSNVSSTAGLRAAVIADHPDRLRDRLKSLITELNDRFPYDGKVYSNPEKWIWMSNHANKPKVGFLFPGQGSQKLNMARMLIERYPWAKELAQKAWEFIPSGKEIVYRSVEKALNQEEKKSWEKELSQTEIAQPTISLASMIWAKHLQKLGIQPDITAGHSLGELTALHLAGAYSEETLLQLAVLRGKAMSGKRKKAGTMASLRCKQEIAEEILSDIPGYVVIANLNSPNQTVISGEEEAVLHAVEIAKNRQISGVVLPVSNAFHSKLVNKAAKVLKDKAPISSKSVKLKIPFVSGVDGKKINHFKSGKSYFSNQVMEQVDFVSLLSTIQEECDYVIEVGPGRVLNGLVADNQEIKLPCFPVESQTGDFGDLNRLLAAYFVSGGEIDWHYLYENRLVRPFIPPYQKEFIVNPCENDLSVPENQPMALASLALPETTDIPQELLNQYLEQRGSFLLDVIRADMKHLGSISAVPASEMNVDSLVVAQLAPTIETSNQTVEQSVIELAAERTGYPVSSIIKDHRLLDDLNLDSIKSAELVSSISKNFGVSDQVDPSGFANATLQDVIQEIESLIPQEIPSVTSVRKNRKIIDVVVEKIQQITGYPSDSIQLGLRLLDDLNLDSIKSAELVAQVSKELNVEDKIDPSQFANSTVHEVCLAIEKELFSKSSSDKQSVRETILTNITELTGYPIDSLTVDLRLLDDLNLDSIKSAELVSKVAKEFGLEQKLDPSSFANSTIDDVEQAFQSLLQEEQQITVQVEKISDDQKAFRSSYKPWVRNFVVDYMEEPFVLSGSTLPSSSRFLLIADKEQDELLQALQEEILQLGIMSEVTTFTELVEDSKLEKEAYSHLVAILPMEENAEISTIVQRLQSVIPPVRDYGFASSITFVQYGGGYFGTRLPEIQLSQCTANSFASSLHMERPHAKIRMIDISPSIAPQEIVNELLEEITAEDSFRAVGYDENKVRRVPRAAVQQPQNDDPRSIEWSSDDVILVTGGAKGITAECAFGIAMSTGAKMALVGSSALYTQSAIQATLSRFREAGIDCQYYQCDISEKSQVEQLVQFIEHDLGQVTGVIHGAALMYPKRAEQISLEAFLQEIGPKVYGALNLCEVLKDHPPKLFVGFSSLSGIAGMAGNTSYGFSNEALQLILRRFEQEHPETQVLSVAFSVWDEVGMGVRAGSVDFLEKKGTYAIPVSEGVQRLVHLFHHTPMDKQVVITAKIGGLDTWNPFPVTRTRNYRFVEEVLYDYPRVELLTQVHLTLSKDPYVKDHVFNGTYLFPAVFGLEAMAQAASYVTGIENFDSVIIKDVQLRLPIALDPKKGVQIQIYAEVLEDGNVKTEIRSEQTGFTKAHFAATFVIQAEEKVPQYLESFPDEPLDIDPKRELYGPLMFQGESYHRIENVYHAEYDREQASGTCSFSASAHDSEYLLGDPYHHDALLQSARVITPQDLCLPVEITTFEKLGKSLTGVYRAVTTLEEQDQAHYTYTVDVIDEQDQVVQRLTGYRVRLMEHHPELPTTKELVSGAFSDEIEVNLVAQEAAVRWGLDTPKVSLTHLSGIHEQGKEERHKRVMPLFYRACSKAGWEDNISLTWSDSGKPRTISGGTISSDKYVSFSHDDEITICTVGGSEQGCDILPIEPSRDLSTWQGLLSEKHLPLLQELMRLGDSVEQAGSRIWSCVESVKKASELDIEELCIEADHEEAILLTGKTNTTIHQVLTMPVSLSKSPQRMLAIVVSSELISKPVVLSPHTPNHLYGEFVPEHGFVYRFPLTFKDATSLSRKVNLTSYATWMGKVRELSLTNILDQVVEQFATGRWGMVTNFAQTKVLGEANTDDIIEVHLQIERMEDESYIEIVYDWYKISNENRLEKIAESRQGLTWVEIIGHGLVKVQPFPEYFAEFVQEKLGGKKGLDNSSERENLFSSNMLGSQILELQNNPINRYVLQKGSFETSLEESNLVGNIYFSNYSTWQGRVRDRFFYQIAPELFQGTGELGEWIPLNSNIHHLREAMPFDIVEVEMSLLKQYENGIKLYFEYYKQVAGGKREKLAYGEQDLLWIERDSEGIPVPMTIPDVFSKELLKVPAKLI